PAPGAGGLGLCRTLPAAAAAGGGLMGATIQLAITAGAGIGGALFDSLGWWGPFAFGGVLLACSAALAWTARDHASLQERNTGQGRAEKRGTI
ncbi:MFS transporter, partial [Pseudomonas syringae]